MKETHFLVVMDTTIYGDVLDRDFHLEWVLFQFDFETVCFVVGLLLLIVACEFQLLRCNKAKNSLTPRSK